MNFISKLKNLFLYSFYLKDEDGKVKNQINSENRKFGILWSFISIFYWGYCFIKSFSDDLFIRCKVVYIVMLAICGISLITLLIVKKSNLLIFIIKILLSVSLLSSGVLIAWILFQDDSMTIILFVSVILVPVLFINNTLTNLLMLISNFIFALIILKYGISSKTYSWAISNIIIFSSLGIILGHFINRSRFERYALSEAAVKLAQLQIKYAQYDQMTDLMNRRAFSEQIDELLEKENPKLTAIMIDINGLKVINDTYGHEAGDKLIIGASQCIRNCFQKDGNCYRLGGDEFCVLIERDDLDCTDNINQLEECCNNFSCKYFKSISFSYGIASTKEFEDIDSTLKEADHRMYEYKNNYYKNSGKDRRHY